MNKAKEMNKVVEHYEIGDEQKTFNGKQFTEP